MAAHLTLPAWRDKMVEMIETMLKLHKDLPKAKTPMTADSFQLTACSLGLVRCRNTPERSAVSRREAAK